MSITGLLLGLINICIVALIALYMIASMLLGRSTITIIGHHQSPPIGGMIAPAPNIITEGRR